MDEYGQSLSTVDPTNKDTRHDFEVYNLDDYNEDLAQDHGLRNDKKSQWI